MIDRENRDSYLFEVADNAFIDASIIKVWAHDLNEAQYIYNEVMENPNSPLMDYVDID